MDIYDRKKMVERMKVTCLMENTLENKLCQAEHGFSLYVETKDTVVLIDTGASGLFIENAKILGVDLSKTEAVFLSHGHYDHGGGILAFSKINSMVPIIMQKKALGDYWHKSVLVEKYIGLDSKVREMENLVLLEGGEYLQQFQKRETGIENIDIFTLKSGTEKELKCWPEGNLVLKEKAEGEYIQDHFEHEQYIVIHENKKSVLISGCAHNGILNILKEYRRKYGNHPDVIISGFHMRKKIGYNKRDYEVIKETAEALKESGILCYTGHCTGEEPYRIMKEIMEEQLQYVHCGDAFVIG